jgi:hypothetical protein
MRAYRLTVLAPGIRAPGLFFAQVVQRLHRHYHARPFQLDLPELRTGTHPQLGTRLHLFSLSVDDIRSALTGFSPEDWQIQELIVPSTPARWARTMRVAFPRGTAQAQRRLLLRYQNRLAAGKPVDRLQEQIASFSHTQVRFPFLPMESNSGTGRFPLYLDRQIESNSLQRTSSHTSYGFGNWVPDL